MNLVLPEVVRANADPAWIAALPGLVDELSSRWKLALGEPLGGGTGAFVTRVTAGGRAAVLKLTPPDPIARRQAQFLVAARGRGYARVIEVDFGLDALLLEELGPSLSEVGIPPAEQLSELADMLLLAWTVPALPDAGSARAAGKAEGLAGLIKRTWRTLGEPCSAAAVELASACAERRAAAFDEHALVAVHGDPHPGNALRRLEEPGAVFIDPDGEPGERAYDLGVTVRDWSFQLVAAPDPHGLLDDFCALLAGRTNEDARAIWEWGYLERVSTGLYALDIGLTEFGGRLLATADVLAG